MKAENADETRGLARGVLTIVAAGIALGLLYNFIGLRSRTAHGVAWIGVDRVAQLESVAAAPAAAPDGDVIYTASDDPLAVAAAAHDALALPQIPDYGRPVQVEIGAVKQFVDASAALLVDAREADEFEAGHIPGSINLPYDQVITDPARLEALDSGGRPIITYCGGGSCQLSLSLAYELIAAGHGRIGVYMGGFPEWQEAGFPVDRGPSKHAGARG